MPVHKVKGGYQWGEHGKVYASKEAAEKQGRAAFANGYRGDIKPTSEGISPTNQPPKPIPMPSMPPRPMPMIGDMFDPAKLPSDPMVPMPAPGSYPPAASPSAPANPVKTPNRWPRG